MSNGDLAIERFRRIAPRRLVWLGVPLLLYGWTVTDGLVLDDLHLLLKTERHLRGESERPALFEFAATEQEWRGLRDRGVLPWWTPAAGRWVFYRPLPERLFRLDVVLFGRNPIGPRLVSLGWFALALLAVQRMFRAVGADPPRAGAATLLWGISQSMTAPVTFLCNRSDVLVVLGLAVAAAAYWRAVRGPDATRREGAVEEPAGVAGASAHLRVLIFGIGGFAVALLSKESAVPFVGVVVADEFVRPGARGPDKWRVRRLGLIAVLGVMAAAYIARYAEFWGRHGAAISAGDLWAHAPRIATAIGELLTVWTAGLPVSLMMNAPTTYHVALAVFGAAGALAVCVWLRSTLRRDAAARFFGIWCVVYLALAGLGAVEARLLSVASVGWAYLLAALVMPAGGHRTNLPRWARFWLLAANGVVSIGVAAGSVLVSGAMERDKQASLREYLAALDPPLRDGEALFVAEARHPHEYFFAADRLEFVTGLRRTALVYLSAAGSKAEVERVDDRTLLLRSDGGGLFDRSADMASAGRPPRVGDAFETGWFTAEVTETTNDAATAVRFRFNHPLEGGGLRFHPPVNAEP